MTNVFPKSGPVRLRANLADSALVAALKEGKIGSDLVGFDFCGPKVASEGFKGMVRDGKFDVGELAIATFLQARTYGKPYALLPATMVGRYQHPCLAYIEKGRRLAPKALEGLRVGVRAYTQTTGVWLRGILRHEHGVEIEKIRWLCHDDPHLAEFSDPPFVERFSLDGRKLEQCLIDGMFDAVIAGAELPKHPEARHLLGDPVAEAAQWSRKYGCTQINHMFVVHEALVAERPDVVREIYRMLAESKAVATPQLSGNVDLLPFGLEACRRSLELVIQYTHEQAIIPRRFTVDELFSSTTAKLGG